MNKCNSRVLGAVNSPQILILSGIGPADHLKEINVPLVQNLPGVGQNLHNHVAFFVNFNINDTNSAPLNWATAMEYLLFRDGLMSGTGKIYIHILIKFASESDPGVVSSMQWMTVFRCLVATIWLDVLITLMLISVTVVDIFPASDGAFQYLQM